MNLKLFFWLSHRFPTYQRWATNPARAEACVLVKRCFPWESNLVFPRYVLGRSSLPLEPKQLGWSKRMNLKLLLLTWDWREYLFIYAAWFFSQRMYFFILVELFSNSTLHGNLPKYSWKFSLFFLFYKKGPKPTKYSLSIYIC